jgi:CheY-like chemotaxis protein
MAARVLVVEPNRIVRRGICAELVASGASVVAEAESGTEAVATAVEHRPDVVLMDYRLPDGSGAEVCAAILKRRPGTAVIVLSANRLAIYLLPVYPFAAIIVAVWADQRAATPTRPVSQTPLGIICNRCCRHDDSDKPAIQAVLRSGRQRLPSRRVATRPGAFRPSDRG